MVAEMPEFEIKDGVLVCYNGCEETVIVPKGVTEIGRLSFKENRSIKHIRLPDTVTVIGFRSFSDYGSPDTVFLRAIATLTAIVRSAVIPFPE